jgi:2-phosphosulfolactate phosphatase
MKIDAYLTPFFPEREAQFNDSVVVMIDVLRASTSVAACLYNGAKEIIPSESVDKAVHIYSSLSKESRFLGGERNGVKPSGFDAGNSPDDYSAESVKGKTVILATSNGTQLFQKCKQAKLKIIAGFVNIDAITNKVNAFVENNPTVTGIVVLCAGTNGRISYEDTICAGAIIERVNGRPEDELTDTAHIAMNLYKSHKNEMAEFIKTREHSVFLKSIGFEKDIETALTFNKYPVVPVISGNSIKKIED